MSGTLANILLRRDPFQQLQVLERQAIREGKNRKGDGYYRNKGLPSYRVGLHNPLFGDLVDNIDRRFRRTGRPVRVLDAGCGEAVAAGALRARARRWFGPKKTIVETLDLEPVSPRRTDRHHQGDFLEVDFGGVRYDLILSLFGVHAYAGERFHAMMERTVDLLQVGGEAVFLLLMPGDRRRQQACYQRYSDLPFVLPAVSAGFLVRYYYSDYQILYLRRLGDQPATALLDVSTSRPRSWASLFETGPDGQFTEAGRRQYVEWLQTEERRQGERLQRTRVALDATGELSQGSFQLPLTSLHKDQIAETMQQIPESESFDPATLLGELFRKFIDEFLEDVGRPPTRRELAYWLDALVNPGDSFKTLFKDSVLARKLGLRLPGSYAFLLTQAKRDDFWLKACQPAGSTRIPK